MSEKSFYNKIRSQRHTADGLHLAPVGRRVSQPRGRIVWLWFRIRAGRSPYGSLAQLAEQVAVNHRVTGSIPVGSVWMDKPFCNFSFVWVPALAEALFLSTYCG